MTTLRSILDGTALVSVTPLHPPPPVHACSLELTAAIVKGDSAAFERLYTAWFPRLLAVARKTTGRDEAFALDIVQDAFLRVIARPVRCDSDGELAAWLRRCVLSAAVDRLRNEARRELRERSRPEPPSSHPDPTEAAERLRWLAASLAEMPSLDQDLLRLKFDLDHTLEQIAASQSDTGRTGRTGWSAVHGKIRRTLDRLRAAASEYFA